jgi:hypothetical protein
MKEQYIKWLNDLKTETNKQLVAEQITGFILKNSFHVPSDEAEDAKAIQEIIKFFPGVHFNFTFIPEAGSMSYERHEKRKGPLKKLPTTSVSCSNRKEDAVYSYEPCSPLMIASLFNLQTHLKIFLAQPTNDLTFRSPVKDLTAYSLTQWTSFNCLNQLKEAAAKQFYHEALSAPLAKKDELLQKYKDTGVTPKEVRLIMIREIMMRVNDEKINPEGKKRLLMEEKYKKMSSDKVLIPYLGKEWGAVEAAINAKYSEIDKNNPPDTELVATQMPTRTFVGSGRDHGTPDKATSSVSSSNTSNRV